MNMQRQENGGFSEERRHQDVDGRLANGLGWFSIGLGLAEVMAPGTVANLIGVRDETKNRALLRFYGLRELAAGVGILMQPRPAGWMWGRVAGDMLDLASLGTAMASEDNDHSRVGTATAAVLGVTALDIICAQRLSGVTGLPWSTAAPKPRAVQSITINRTPEEVYSFWHNFENLATFMRHLISVQTTGPGRSHWKARGPAGKVVEWDAEITHDQPSRSIGWRSLPGADVDNSGSVRFDRAPGGRGTIVRVEIEYAPPGGAVGASIARLFASDPGQLLEEDLRAFKQIMEVGEVIKSDASIHRGMHAAQPPERYDEELVAR